MTMLKKAFSLFRLYRFDLSTETWSNMGIKAPAPPNWGSFVFSVDGLLYRLRGRTGGAQSTYYDILSTYNPATNKWQANIDLPYTAITTSRYRVVFTLNVLVPKV